jgi:arylsulfatase A-like enzyme
LCARPATMRLPQLLGIAVLALGACSQATPPVPVGPGRLDRPALTATEVAELPGNSVTPILIPEDLSAWAFQGRPPAPIGAGPERRILFEAPTKPTKPTKPTGEEPASPGPVRIAIPIVPSRPYFDRVVVTGVFPSPFEVQLQLDGGATRPYRSSPMTTHGGDKPQSLTFDLDPLRGRNIPFENLRLQFAGSDGPFDLTGIDLVQRPHYLLLPRLGADPATVSIGDQSRRAHGLPPELAAECSFEVRHADEQLSFSSGAPLAMRASEGQAAIMLTLSNGSGVQLREHIPVPVRRGPVGWTETDIPLGEFVGQRLTARFQYRCAAEQPGIAVLGEVRVWRPAERPRLVLLVSSDTHRADHVAAMAADLELDGNLQTPGLDRLALGGLLFESCQATTNVTSPSHVAMLTALHPRDTHLISNLDRLGPEARTLAEAFLGAGWRTFGVVSVHHLGPQGTNLAQGFDRMRSPEDDPWGAKEARAQLGAWIDGAPGQPVFAFLHVFDAHHPYAPPESYDRLYYPEDKDPFDPSQAALEVRRGSIPRDYWGRLRDPRFPKAQYAAEVTYLDGVVGEFFRRPRIANGLIAFTADHGEILEKAGTYFNHGELYPDTLHVPLILGGALLPREFQGSRVSRPVSQLGLARTLLDLAGLTDVAFPGRNLLLDAQATGPAPPLFALSAHGKSASMTRDGWFLLLHLRDHQDALAEPRFQHQAELFDLATDPECLDDLSATEGARLADLRRELIAWLDAAAPQSFSTRHASTATEVAALKALGYTTNMDPVESGPWYVPDEQDQ